MSLNYETGTPIAYDNLTGEIVNYDYNNENGFKEAQGNFEIVPTANQEREIVYCVGMSGSGKSTSAKLYALAYRNLFPKNDILMFSQFESDKAFDEHQKELKIRRVIINNKFLNFPINVIKEFKDCLIIFDDCMNFPDKKLNEKIKNIITQVCTLGRKNNISAFITNHLLYGDDPKLYRLLMVEIHKLIFYRGSNIQQVRRCLNVYFGYDNRTISKIINLKSRWICINKLPQYALTQSEIFVL